MSLILHHHHRPVILVWAVTAKEKDPGPGPCLVIYKEKVWKGGFNFKNISQNRIGDS